MTQFIGKVQLVKLTKAKIWWESLSDEEKVDVYELVKKNSKE